MPDFDKLLQESLLGVNKAFEQADTDLHELVAEASQALGRVTNGVVEMALRKFSEDLDGVLYELFVRAATDYPKKPEGVSAGAYLVSTKGYPVKVGLIERIERTSSRGVLLPDQPTFRPQLDLLVRAELQRHFEDLMANPDSPVITNAAFFMRRAASAYQR